MAEQDLSALSLFWQFLPKHNEMKWKPGGFRLGVETAEFGFFPDTDASYTDYEEYPSINIKTAGLEFTFTYDLKSRKDPVAQMLYTCWDAILAGPFKGRTFRVEPAKGGVEKAFKALAKDEHSENIPIRFTYDGERIRGLSFPTNMSADWNFFIPASSPEGKAVAAALALEQAEHKARTLSKKVEEQSNLAPLKARLTRAMGAVT